MPFRRTLIEFDWSSGRTLYTYICICYANMYIFDEAAAKREETELNLIIKCMKINYTKFVVQYELRLAASDNLKENYTTVIIHVKDVNDNPPVFERPTYRTQITEEDDRNLPKRVLQVIKNRNQTKYKKISCSLQLPFSMICSPYHVAIVPSFLSFHLFSFVALFRCFCIRHVAPHKHRIFSLIKHRFYCMSWVSCFSSAWEFTAQLDLKRKQKNQKQHELSLLLINYLFTFTWLKLCVKKQRVFINADWIGSKRYANIYFNYLLMCVRLNTD